eukprot:XP_001698989.1 predicted protein [Chlamydomonas reinhardtii]
MTRSFYETGDFQNSWSHYDGASGQLVQALGLPQTGAQRRAAGLLPPLKMRWWAITRLLEQELPPAGVVALHYGCRLLDCAELAEEEGAADAGGSGVPPEAADEGASGCVGAAIAGGGGGGSSGGEASASERYRYRLTFEIRSSSPQAGDGGSSSGSGSGNTGGGSSTRLTVLAKWLIGADGGFSRVGDGRAPVFTGYFSWWGRVSGAELAAAAAAAGGAADVDSLWPAPLRGPPRSPMVRNAVYLPAADRISTTKAVVALLVRMRSPSQLGQGQGQEVTAAGAAAGAVAGAVAGAAAASAGGGGAEAGCSSLRDDGGEDEVVAWYLEAQTAHLEAAGLDASPEGHAVALARCLAVSTHLPPDVRAALAATPPARVLERALHMHPPEQLELSSWTNGCGMVLVGDAVHSAGRPDGQGGSLAFEDAAELAAAVRRHGLGQQAFDSFAASRLPRVKGIRGDNAPPFAVRRALMDATAFEPLWGPADLPRPEELLGEELGRMRVCAGGEEVPHREAGQEVAERQGGCGGQQQHAEAGVVTVVARVGMEPGLEAAAKLDPEAVRAWSRRCCWEVAERRTAGHILQAAVIGPVGKQG